MSSETLTIAANNDTTTFTEATFTVELLEDDLDEFDELFEVVLSSAVNATIEAGTDDGTALVTIEDNDALPELVVGVPAVVEGDGSVVVDVGLSAVSGRTVVVDYDTANMTDDELESVTGLSGLEAREHGAVAGDDYTLASGVVEFAPGEDSASVSVALLEDVLDEYDELFALGLVAIHVTAVEKVFVAIRRRRRAADAVSGAGHQQPGWQCCRCCSCVGECGRDRVPDGAVRGERPFCARALQDR